MALNWGRKQQTLRPGVFPPLFQGGKSQAKLELQGVLGVEIATAVAAHNFQLAMDGFDDVGGGKRTTDGIWISEEGQVVLALLAQFGDEGWVGIEEAITELVQRLVAHFRAPARLDHPPTLLKLGVVEFAEMVSGVALHMHHTQLHIGLRKQGLGDGEQSGKIIVNEEQNTT